MRLRTLAVGTAFAAVVLGDRMVCHPPPDGPAYAGGLGLKTPFGIIYSTNITPDPDTGIGRWTSAAFRRALREGVARDGQVVNPDGIASMDWSTYPILRFSGVPERIDVDLLDQPGLPFPA